VEASIRAGTKITQLGRMGAPNNSPNDEFILISDGDITKMKKDTLVDELALRGLKKKGN